MKRSRPRPVLLMVRALDLGGTERQLAQAAATLDRSCFDPHVACFHAQGMRGDELRASGVPVIELPVRSFRGASAARGAWLLGRYLRAHGIELVHTFDVPMNIFGVPAARFWRTPVVLSSQRAHRALTPGMFRHALRVTDRLVDGIVVNSRAVAKELVQEDRTPAGLIHFLPNGIDTRVFRRSEGGRPEPLRDASLVIGIVCALRGEKNLPALLQAFARIRTPGNTVKLAIVGSGPEQSALVELSRSLSLSGSVHFEPAVRDVPRWLTALDIFVLPSRSEASSNSLLEAMSCGCCAVASNIGGNPELIRHGETGLLFEPDDVDSLAANLERLVREPNFRQTLGAAGAVHVQRDFSLAAAAARLGEIYDSLCENR